MEETRICPVCGAAAGTAGETRCKACGFENAFVKYFSSPEAKAAWRAEVERRAAAYRAKTTAGLPVADPGKPPVRPEMPAEKPAKSDDRPAPPRAPETPRVTRKPFPWPSSWSTPSNPKYTKPTQPRTYRMYKDDSGIWLAETYDILVFGEQADSVDYWPVSFPDKPSRISTLDLERCSDYSRDPAERDEKAQRMKRE